MKIRVRKNEIIDREPGKGGADSPAFTETGLVQDKKRFGSPRF
jgi:hypothetical protein